MARFISALVLILLIFNVRPAQADYAAIVIDSDHDKVLHALNADAPNYPASLTKMMTLYIAFSRLKSHQLTLDQYLPVSSYATTMEPSILGLRAGQEIKARDAILGVVTKSANDAAVVLAEAMAGSEAAFAALMTKEAAALGMAHTHFANANGLPNPDNISTARDMAYLGLALIRDFPEYYPFFSTRSFTYRGEVNLNHNHLLGRVPGLDGIKTGFIRTSGFNLVASAKRNGRRLIAVVMGGASPGWRDQRITQLLDIGFKVAPDSGEKLDLPPELLMANSHTTAVAANVALPTEARSAVQLAAADLTAWPGAPAQPGQRRLHNTLISRILGRSRLVMKAAPPAAASQGAASPGAGSPTPVAINSEINPAMTHEAKSWSVQVGAYASRRAAIRAGATTTRIAGNYVTASEMTISNTGTRRRSFYRVRFVGLSEQAAENACRVIAQRGQACQAIPATS